MFRFTAARHSHLKPSTARTVINIRLIMRKVFYAIFFLKFYLCRPKFALVRSGEDIELGVASSRRTLVDVNSPQIYIDATGASAKREKKKKKEEEEEKHE